MVQLTQIAHELIRDFIKTGDLVIDATCGNGHDTFFLSELVGESGTVLACDLQQLAIDATKDRCRERQNIEYHLGDHAQVLQSLLEEYQSSVSAILFNLGYLPGGDKSLTTTGPATVSAIQLGLQLLKTGGVLSVLAYVGHPGGIDEANAVESFLTKSIDSAELHNIHWPDESRPAMSPLLYVVCKASD